MTSSLGPQILEDVTGLLAARLGVDPATAIDEETRFFADLGLASIDAVVLGEAIQAHLRPPPAVRRADGRDRPADRSRPVDRRARRVPG